MKFSQSVTVPAHAKTQVYPYSKSIKGTVPITMLYSLRATKSTSDDAAANWQRPGVSVEENVLLERYQRLWKTLDKYVPQDGVRMSKNDDEKVILLEIDGVLVHSIDVHIEPFVPLPYVDCDEN